MDRNAHIHNAEIEQDIADTEAEIATMRREVEGFNLIGDRLSYMRASARRAGIREREEFIAKLKAILAERGAIYAPPQENK